MADTGETSTSQEKPVETMTPYIDLPTRFDRWEPLAEVLATIILAFATLATAWSGYQAARWGGVQASSYSQAGALRTESTRVSTEYGQLVQIDIAIFINWINAYTDDDQAKLQFYRDRFRDEFKPAFKAWMATDPFNNPFAPRSPFGMQEYQLSQKAEAEQLLAEAQATFAKGSEANQTSDNYVLNTVILAGVLFLAGIVTRFKAMPARWVIIVLSLIFLAYGLFNIIRYPIN